MPSTTLPRISSLPLRRKHVVKKIIPLSTTKISEYESESESIATSPPSIMHYHKLPTIENHRFFSQSTSIDLDKSSTEPSESIISEAIPLKINKFDQLWQEMKSAIQPKSVLVILEIKESINVIIKKMDLLKLGIKESDSALSFEDVSALCTFVTTNLCDIVEDKALSQKYGHLLARPEQDFLRMSALQCIQDAISHSPEILSTDIFFSLKTGLEDLHNHQLISRSKLSVAKEIYNSFYLLSSLQKTIPDNTLISCSWFHDSVSVIYKAAFNQPLPKECFSILRNKLTCYKKLKSDELNDVCGSILFQVNHYGGHHTLMSYDELTILIDIAIEDRSFTDTTRNSAVSIISDYFPSLSEDTQVLIMGVVASLGKHLEPSGHLEG